MSKVAKRNRKSNIELLRIIAMAMIISSHYSHYVHWDLSEVSVLQDMKVMMFIPLGTAGATIFFIVTGYFSSKNKRTIEASLQVELKKIVKIWAEALFYSLIVVSIFIVLGMTVEKGQLLTAFFLLTRNEYWFVSAYVILCLLSPFMNLIIKQLQMREYALLLLVLSVQLISASLGNNLLTNNLLAITAYFVGGFLRKFPVVRWKYNNWYLFGINVLIYILGMTSILGMKLLGISPAHQGHFTSDLFAIIFASSIFLQFLNINIRHSSTLNLLASTVFASYLISENPLFRPILWNSFFNIKIVQNSMIFPIWGVLMVLIIMVASSFIDLIRQSAISIINRLFKLDIRV